MKRLVAGLAFLASASAFLLIAGGGLVLVMVENSGERLAGGLLLLSGLITFAAAAILVFAKRGAFAGGGGKALALTAALLGMLPSAALCVGALRFSGFPLGSATPLVDWPVFGIGLYFALGALAILATGYWRTRESDRAQPGRVRSMQHVSDVQRPAAEAAYPAAALSTAHAPHEEGERPAQRPGSALEDDEDVRVTPVDLPSIAQFRRR